MGLTAQTTTQVEVRYTCERCGYRSGAYGSEQMPRYYGERHEALCCAAAAAGLRPILESWVAGGGTDVVGWERVSDGAQMIVCDSTRYEPTGRVVQFYADLAAFARSEPLETYVVPADWSLLTHPAPWLARTPGASEDC